MFSNKKYLKYILCSPIYKIVRVTPLQIMKKISYKLGNTILVKREDQQIVNSFKIRGAYSMIYSLKDRQKYHGIITASAGNHAQGVALSANKLGINSTIVMPVTTSDIKINAVKSYNSKVILFGNNFDESKKKALQLSKKFKYTFIPPFDHPMIIAGQGTIAMEIIKQDYNFDKIFVPVGGGGLISGIAILIKNLLPHIKIIAVESEDSACLKAAFNAGKPINLKYVGLFADGVAVKKIGKENFRICKSYVDDIITVDNDLICASIKDLYEDIRAIAEPSGALALAGIKKYVKKFKIKNERLVHILSGSNINFHRLRYISERCEIGEQKEILLAVSIIEQKGSFLNFCSILNKKIITEFNYRYSEKNKAFVLIGIKLFNGIKEKKEIIDLLNNNNYKVIDLTNNEIAKSHIRYMIGGKNQINEKLYNFVFPEYEGALLEFLKLLGVHWNITLFHYRSHGTDYGNVLIGLQINEKLKFEHHVRSLGYHFNDETHNSAFKFFLSN